jgi:hypothetical protein
MHVHRRVCGRTDSEDEGEQEEDGENHSERKGPDHEDASGRLPDRDLAGVFVATAGAAVCLPRHIVRAEPAGDEVRIGDREVRLFHVPSFRGT